MITDVYIVTFEADTVLLSRGNNWESSFSKANSGLITMNDWLIVSKAWTDVGDDQNIIQADETQVQVS